MLSVENLRHQYGGQLVFDKVNLHLVEPMSAAIVGPSGVGKTTLLSIIGGLIRPSHGTVTLTASDRRDGPPASVSWITQASNVFRNRSVMDNILCPLLLGGISVGDAVRRARSALAKTGLGDREISVVRQLSGGERQRVGIARAIATASDVILADEPTGQLDESATSRVVRTLITDRPRQSLLLVVTHDPVVAGQCDRQYQLAATGLQRIQ